MVSRQRGKEDVRPSLMSSLMVDGEPALIFRGSLLERKYLTRPSHVALTLVSSYPVDGLIIRVY